MKNIILSLGFIFSGFLFAQSSKEAVSCEKVMGVVQSSGTLVETVVNNNVRGRVDLFVKAEYYVLNNKPFVIAYIRDNMRQHYAKPSVYCKVDADTWEKFKSKSEFKQRGDAFDETVAKFACDCSSTDVK